MWQLMANYTYKNDNPFNIGAGVVMTTGIFQLFLATDNVIPFCRNIGGVKDATFTWGLNFFMGRKRDNVAKMQIYR
jgi:hypothetical protein